MDTTFRKARITKDKNFDGKFFFAVRTTGIFCRPSCPSPIAKEENVIYFNTIFEALENGFRPCFRCRPDISTEYYNGHPDGVFVVTTALKMIYDGYLNYSSVRDLSKELLVSDRHLRMLFVDHLGVPPVKIAKYHKALFAKKLLIFSDQSVTDIAYASGFGSIRQFNDVFKEIFGKTPTMVRKEIMHEKNDQDNPTLLLKYKKPFDFNQTLSFMRQRAIPGIEAVTENTYARTFRTDHANGFFIVTDNPGQSALELKIGCNDIKCYMEICNRVRKMFDLDTDFSMINRRFAKDKYLSKGMINGHVPRLPVLFDPFESVIRAVLGQQISVKAAITLAARLVRKAAIKCDNDSPFSLDYYFPNPSELLKLNPDGLGISKTRQTTIKTVVSALLNKDFTLTVNQPPEKFCKEFSALKGIGDWTVNYVAIRGLGMTDSFPAGDLGIARSLATGDKMLSEKEIREMAENWRPYRSYAALCLWNSEQNKE